MVANQEYSLPVNSNQKRCRKHNRTQRGLFTLYILNGTLNRVHTDSVVILCVFAGPQLVAHGFTARILTYCTCSQIFYQKRDCSQSVVSVDDDRIISRRFCTKTEAIIQMHLVYHTLDFRSLVSTNENDKAIRRIAIKYGRTKFKH